MLRIGILLNSFKVPKWVKSCLEVFNRLDFCKVVLVILNQSPPKGHSDFSTLLQRRFYKLDRWRNKQFDLLLPEHDVSKLLENIPVFSVKPEKINGREAFTTDQIEAIATYDLDILLRFGFGILTGKILNSAKQGVWSFHHGDNDKYRGGPPALWETLRGEKCIGQILQRLTESLDGGIILERAWTLAHNTSVIKSQHHAFSRSHLILKKCLRKLNDGILKPESSRPYDQRFYKAPTNWEFIKLLPRYLKQQLFKMPKTEMLHWRLLYKHGVENSIYRFKELQPSQESFWADPFLIRYGDKNWVFFEEYNYRHSKGRICAGELKEPFEPVVALEERQHLSYPNMIPGLFMTPDSDGSFKLYHCAEFPNKWDLLYKIRLDEPIHNPTLFFHDGLWWLFCSSTNDTLWLYYTADLLTLSEWKAHPQNPIVIDAKGARPAGRIFFEDKKIIRPAQDYTHSRIYALRFKEIIKLTTVEYEEKDYGTIRPEWHDKVQGIHTVNFSESTTVFDALYLK